MTLPSIQTFEGDISEEIKDKETTMTDIIAAHKTKDIEIQQARQKTNLFFFLVLFFIIGLAVVVAGAYFLYTKTGPTQAIPQEIPQPITEVVPISSVSILQILPETGAAINRFIRSIQKENGGYIVTITDYASVYGYLLQNEQSFGLEAHLLLNTPSETETPPLETIVFTDITQANQDMRVYTSNEDLYVVYGFIGTSTLLLSPSPEDFLTLRSGILK